MSFNTNLQAQLQLRFITMTLLLEDLWAQLDLAKAQLAALKSWREHYAKDLGTME